MRLALAVVSALALAACTAAPLPPAPVPPAARAPAPPGTHRAKTPQGVDLVFDASRGVYAVASAPDRFWVDQRFYRRGPEGWLVAPALDGPWTECPPGELPAGLRSEEAR